MATLDFQKCSADERVAVFMSPSGGATVGITNIHEPLAVELNNTGGTSTMLNISASLSWNDFDYGFQASETLNEPSFADSATFEEFGQYNAGEGSMSFFLPAAWDDNSNLHSLVYDMTAQPDTTVDVAIRLDGDVKTTVAAANGDLVYTFRSKTDGETNPFTPGESKRRTVSFYTTGEFATGRVVVGDHAITAIAPGTFGAGDKGRIRARQQSRDTTNYLTWSTSDVDVIDVYPGGYFVVTGAALDTATVTITDPGTGDTQTVSVTVS